MIIQFIKEIELQIVESIDEESDTINDSTEVFQIGEENDVDVFGDHPEDVDMQFGDGSCAFHVPKNAYTIIKR